MRICIPLAFTLLLAAGCASVQKLDSSKHETIMVPQGIQDPAVLQGVGHRITNGLPVIFKVAQGEQIPFKLLLELPMGTLNQGESTFAFNRDTYFLLSQKGMSLSPDGQRWASIARPKALSKLFGFEHGEVSFGFSSSTNEPPFMRVEAKVK